MRSLPPGVRATYRRQLHAGFDFAEAAALVPYPAELGVSHLYASPIVGARAGSTHGYDVVDPGRIRADLGGEQGFERLGAALAAHGMGLLLDIVPNHMAASEESPWWRDVLARGRSSRWAGVFDIYWSGDDRWGTFDQGLLLPELGTPYEQALSERVLRLERRDDGVVVRCYDRTLPTAAASWPAVLDGMALADPRVPTHLASLPPAQVDAFLRAQPWQPVHWRLAEVAGYRRFFDINDLVGVRAEDPEVFAATHALLIDLVRRGLVSGLRVDHVDGLRDPRAYLERRAAVTDVVVVEKILVGEERLRPDWPVVGTVGYEFSSAASGVFVDRDGRERLHATWRRFTGNGESFDDLAHRLKLRLLDELFRGERDRLGSFLRRLASACSEGLDLSPQALKAALATVTAAMPVYRTYVTGPDLSTPDRQHLDAALREARRRRPDIDRVVFDFLERVLTLADAAALPPATLEQRREFVMSWQQLTGPLMAKGVEDTALYRWTPLRSLNAVGSEPDPAPERLSIDAFHAHNAHVQQHWPGTLLSTSTHDSKRGEDVRCRLHALADVPRLWDRALRRFHRHNAPLRARMANGPVPDAAEEVLLYQTLLGAWPLQADAVAGFPARVAEFIGKAAREAKRRTSWLRPDAEHEAALTGFVAAALAPGNRAFLTEFATLQRRIAGIGAWNSLALLTLKLAAPGVPDFYQGSELWHFRLVDPDHRQPVDFSRRRDLLAGLRDAEPSAASVRTLRRCFADGRIKLFVTWRRLQLRARHPEPFVAGDYLPLAVEGPRAAFVCAFARTHADQWVLCAVPSRIGAFGGGRPPNGAALWRDTNVVLPAAAPTTYVDGFTGRSLRADGRRLPLGAMFRILPVFLAVSGSPTAATGPPTKP